MTEQTKTNVHFPVGMAVCDMHYGLPSKVRRPDQDAYAHIDERVPVEILHVIKIPCHNDGAYDVLRQILDTVGIPERYMYSNKMAVVIDSSSWENGRPVYKCVWSWNDRTLGFFTFAIAES